MNKPLSLSLLGGLIVMIAGGLWLLRTPAKTPAPAATTATVPFTPPAAKPAPAAPVPPRDKPVAFPAKPAPTPAPAALTIDSLLTNTVMDDSAIMAGLSKIALDDKRGLDERTEAIGHLLNLSVEDPAPVLLPLITDARLPDSLCERILDDSLNDPLAWQADAALAVLKSRQGPEIRTKARDNLTFLVEKDYGDDLAAWTKAVALAKPTWDKSESK